MTKHRFQHSWLLALAGVVLAGSAPAHAGIVVSVTSANASAGDVGGFIDVNVQNTGRTLQNLASFSVGLSVSDSRITFTGGDTSTLLTYLFNGDSFDVNNGFPLLTVPPPNGMSVQASDLSDSGVGTDLGPTSMGLARIYFNVAPDAAPGMIAVTLASDCLTSDSCTSFADSGLNDVPFTTTGGTITINESTAAPEPSTIFLSLFGISALAWRRIRR